MDSPDGDQGYPGLLGIVVTYSLSDADLNIHFQATTDKTTHVNLTSHPYFNLSGSAESPIDDHLLMLCSQSFLETNSEQIPTGRVIPTVDGSLDFATARSIGNTRLDHTFLLSRWQDTRKGQLDLAAVLYCPSSGIGCRILTDLPALQVYSGEHLPAPFLARRGLALEAQYPPNACNLEGLPSTLLEPGTVYNHTIRYSFANDVGFD
jgi:aldose 1-epimerase